MCPRSSVGKFGIINGLIPATGTLVSVIGTLIPAIGTVIQLSMALFRLSVPLFRLPVPLFRLSVPLCRFGRSEPSALALSGKSIKAEPTLTFGADFFGIATAATDELADGSGQKLLMVRVVRPVPRWCLV